MFEFTPLTHNSKPPCPFFPLFSFKWGRGWCVLERLVIAENFPNWAVSELVMASLGLLLGVCWEGYRVTILFCAVTILLFFHLLQYYFFFHLLQYYFFFLYYNITFFSFITILLFFHLLQYYFFFIYFNITFWSPLFRAYILLFLG